MALSIQATADGYVVAGQKDYICEVDVRVPICAAQHAAAWILKLDERGEIIWQKTYAPLSSVYSYAAAAQSTADGGYVVAGVTLDSALGWVLKLDANDDVGSCAQLGTSDATSVTSTVVAQNGSALAMAASLSALPSAFLVELDASPPQQQCNALPPPSQLAVEYYQRDYNHYFVTSSKPEIAALDAGAFHGWGRTGEYFRVLELGAGNANVCRFWSAQSFAPKSSHFYTPFESECASTKTNPNWQFEGEVFSMHLTGDGSCANGTASLYRLYNDGIGGAPNHRYTTREYIRSQMITQGWMPEGVGIGVIGCVPLD